MVALWVGGCPSPKSCWSYTLPIRVYILILCYTTANFPFVEVLHAQYLIINPVTPKTYTFSMCHVLLGIKGSLQEKLFITTKKDVSISPFSLQIDSIATTKKSLRTVAINLETIG